MQALLACRVLSLSHVFAALYVLWYDVVAKLRLLSGLYSVHSALWLRTANNSHLIRACGLLVSCMRIRRLT